MYIYIFVEIIERYINYYYGKTIEITNNRINKLKSTFFENVPDNNVELDIENIKKNYKKRRNL